MLFAEEVRIDDSSSSKVVLRIGDTPALKERKDLTTIKDLVVRVQTNVMATAWIYNMTEEEFLKATDGRQMYSGYKCNFCVDEGTAEPYDENSMMITMRPKMLLHIGSRPGEVYKDIWVVVAPSAFAHIPMSMMCFMSGRAIVGDVKANRIKPKGDKKRSKKSQRYTQSERKVMARLMSAMK